MHECNASPHTIANYRDTFRLLMGKADQEAERIPIVCDECNASPHTIANYRDTFRLLIGFAHRHLKKPPTALAMQDLDASFVCRFLDHLEKDRGVSARSRNVRLAAIHSFFHYVALQEPALGALAQRVLAIKSKRYARKPVDFLTRAEAEALLSAPNQETWS